MQRAILFRYHTRPAICANRIALLRKLNPHTPIYGMYGGPQVQPPTLPFDHNYKMPFEDARFKWQNGDLCIRQWFKDCGNRFRFDMLHIIEWDLIFMQPLAEIFAHVTGGIGMAEFKNIAELRAGGWGWITRPEGKKQLEELREFVRKKYGHVLPYEQQLASVFPCTRLSRAFLGRYAKDEIPALVHDEVRVPMFAQIYGMPLFETRLTSTLRHWNCNKDYVAADKVYAASRTLCSFHPIKDRLNLTRLLAEQS
jgi:hypothetical protein